MIRVYYIFMSNGMGLSSIRIPTFNELHIILLLTVISLKRNPGIKGKPSIFVLFIFNIILDIKQCYIVIILINVYLINFIWLLGDRNGHIIYQNQNYK